MKLSNGINCSCWFYYCHAEKTKRKSFWLELTEVVSTRSGVWMILMMLFVKKKSQEGENLPVNQISFSKIL